MTLSRKNTRTIVVAGVRFRWVVSPQDTQIVFVAEAADVKGQKIEVTIDSDTHRFWVEFPNVSGFNLKAILPKDAATIVSQALLAGWQPLEKSPPLKFHFRGELLETRSD